MKGAGNELEKSKNVLRDTGMEPQPIIEATGCTSQHKPRRGTEHLIRFQCQERESFTHISERHLNDCRAKITFCTNELKKSCECILRFCPARLSP